MKSQLIPNTIGLVFFALEVTGFSSFDEKGDLFDQMSALTSARNGMITLNIIKGAK